MDSEAIQILNLSPIPELSEMELSTMLEHLSGLSDINGDLTDRNVEDILREAEDLIDRSTSSKTLESRSVNKSPEAEVHKLEINNQPVNVLKDKDQSFQLSDLEENKQQTTSIKSNSQVNIFTEINENRCSNSPILKNSSMLYSPGSSCNPIKSTIDSLKEFSTYIEKKVASQSPKSSPKFIEVIKKNQNESYNKEVKFSNSPIIKKSFDTKKVSDNLKIVKVPDLVSKKNETEPLDKSINLLNCFERLYRDKPKRLSSKKLKVVDKLPKTIIKKKLSRDLKNNRKNWQGKNVAKTNANEDLNAKADTNKDLNAKTYQKSHQPFVQTLYDCDNTINSKYYLLNERKCLLENEAEDKLSEQNPLNDNFQSDTVIKVQSRSEDILMQKNLEGIKENKDQMNKVITHGNGENSKKIVRENEKSIEIPKPKGDSTKDIHEMEFNRNSGIKRLEEQFCILKEKYNYQIDKLEAENFRLREALNRQQKTYSTQEYLRGDNGGSVLNFPFSFPEKKARTYSLENCRTPKNSPCSSSEDIPTLTIMKEAFSQTEKNLKNTSVQCSQESREVGANSNMEVISETKITENKENLISKKKPGKSKAFSDVNVHYSIRQKRAVEHETQLMATLRGLQAEVTAKDKENRKLKNEVESLKKQMKKLRTVKVENCRKTNIGTQTIGLGTFVQKPYNPKNYEVPLEFEKENEDLRFRIKALEEDFEFLKEKRISDLQSLHQVHEEEMAKLLSKLETQSALTKHLHSLLVNR